METLANVPSSSPESSPNENEDFAPALESAKLQALYNFAYGLSHEINNPLANISARAQTLLVEEKDPERRRKLATIVQQAFRAHEMIADLMLFARPPALKREPVDLEKLADTVVAEMQEQARAQNTTLLRTSDSGPLIAQVDPTQIAVTLKALLQNSLEAVKQGGQIEVSAKLGTRNAEQLPVPPPHFPTTPRSEFPAPRSLSPVSSAPYSPLPTSYSLLSVADTGPGIPPSLRPHIFDPFFSGREAGRGLGLGLSKARRIIQLHGGQIYVESPSDQRATFTIALPTC